MKNFELTKEIMQNAKTYMPLYMKCELALDIAYKTLENQKKLNINEEVNKTFALPLLKNENIATKMMCLLNILLSYYFNLKIDKLNYDKYDKYCNMHILNQIERFKSDPDLKNKAFDILTDYKEFKKIVDLEIYNLKIIYNDPLIRLTKSLYLLNSPENIKKIAQELTEISADFKNKEE